MAPSASALTTSLSRAARCGSRPGHLDLPVFLCPILLRLPRQPRRSKDEQRCKTSLRPRCRHLHQEVDSSLGRSQVPNQVLGTLRHLPSQCAGCGALAQTTDSSEPGYYSLRRRTVKNYLGLIPQEQTAKRDRENEAYATSLQGLDPKVLRSLHLGSKSETKHVNEAVQVPTCDRCHALQHHQTGTSIQHPTIKSIQNTIFESPFKYNHVYHVVDAADFPMSLIPSLYRLLQLIPQRSMNRRSKTGKFYHGRKTEVSFIITRSDLLAPLKSQVDTLMPYLSEVLREGLGSLGKDVRLGNVRCVSAKRGWWTKELKEDVWKRGGGGWMVGKVNVGKSQLFESVFPKGRRAMITQDSSPALSKMMPGEELSSPDVKTSGTDDNNTVRSTSEVEDGMSLHADTSDTGDNIVPVSRDDLETEAEMLENDRSEVTDTDFLLPPAQPETDYPTMPLVSALPGTTASPIRVPFGNGKGELIDLPGLSRGDLEVFVQDEHKSALVMRSRVTPEQQILKPGQSLLVGGFIRITPATPDLVFMAYAFLPLPVHVTSNDKAIGIQRRERPTSVVNISAPGVEGTIKSAGHFALKWDVTKRRSGPITAPSAAGLRVETLPYKVMSTDILIEGVGWIELVAQVRKRSLEQCKDAPDEAGVAAETTWPQVEIFSPEGRFLAARRPLGAWVLGGLRKPVAGQKGRPRPSMKGFKKRAKTLGRT